MCSAQLDPTDTERVVLCSSKEVPATRTDLQQRISNHIRSVFVKCLMVGLGTQRLRDTPEKLARLICFPLLLEWGIQLHLRMTFDTTMERMAIAYKRQSQPAFPAERTASNRALPFVPHLQPVLQKLSPPHPSIM